MNEVKKSFSFGGGETLELTCLEAADRFVKNVLSKNLESENVWFPEHIIRLGVTPEGPKLSEEKHEERGNQITEPREKILYNTYLTALKGNECEKAVWDYIIRTPSDVRCATFMSYDNKMFLQFTGASDTTKTEAPDAQNLAAEKSKAPDAEKTEASDAKKVEASYTEKTKASDAEKAEAPDAKKAEATNAKKAEAQDAEKVEATDAEKTEALDAEKVEDSDLSTTANKLTQIDAEDEDLKKVPKIKAKKSANTQAHEANKPYKAMANKSTKDEDHGDNKCPDGRSHKATQTGSPRRKANKDPLTALTDNQEFDFVFLLGEYKTFVVFEVKASFKGTGNWKEQLERAELFYKTIIKYIGDEDYKDWTFLPVAAFPTATDIKQVIFFSVIIKKII